MAKICATAAVPRVRLHDLRHQHATALLTNGAAVHEVADRLGHRDGTVTLQVYAHVLSGRDAHLAEAFAASAPIADLLAESGHACAPLAPSRL